MKKKKFFIFKQKTAYEIKECDWSSDVCSSDLKMTNTQLQKIEPLAARAIDCDITDAITMTDAAQFLSELNQQNDRIKAEKAKVVNPLNEALKEERARWKPAETILSGAISTIRSKIGIYQTEEKQRDRKSTRLNSSHIPLSRMPSSA